MKRRSCNNNLNILITFGLSKKNDKKNTTCSCTRINLYENKENKQVYFVGGGLASLAGAAYLIRDCNFKGENIHIIEGLRILGGSNDGAGNNEEGFVCRGGRMLQMDLLFVVVEC